MERLDASMVSVRERRGGMLAFIRVSSQNINQLAKIAHIIRDAVRGSEIRIKRCGKRKEKYYAIITADPIWVLRVIFHQA